MNKERTNNNPSSGEINEGKIVPVRVPRPNPPKQSTSNGK